jgi:cyclase
MTWRCVLGTMVLVFALSGRSALTQSDMSNIEITTIPVAENIYMLVGSGGNIGLCVGEDAVFMIDDQFAPLTDKIMAAVRKLSDKPVKVLLNTHWHFDHTGGNERFGKMGATIIAHDNVYARMSTEQKTPLAKGLTPPSPPAALPVITYAESATIHLCGYTIRAQKVVPAHTDGDTVVHFVEADVYHMGDTFFNGSYPFFDQDSGGDINGVVEVAKEYAAMVSPTAKLIPGHGPLSNKAELESYAEVLEAIRDRVAEAIENSKTPAEIKAMQLTKDFDAKWGNGMLAPAEFTKLVVDSLLRKQ